MKYAMLGILAFAIACIDVAEPTTRSSPPVLQPAPSAPRAKWTGCPAGNRVFDEGTAIYQAYYESISGPLTSKYILCDDKTFSLEFESGNWGVFDYLGTYIETDSSVTLDFKDFLMVTARRQADTLFVIYGSAMNAADFVDGPYILERVP